MLQIGNIEKNTIAIKKAFASYSSKDREKVIQRVQGIFAAGVEVYLDIVNLRSGEKWAAEIRRNIIASDVFYLFWSSHARDSAYVREEWQCALETKGLDFINPLPLEDPNIVPPPKELSSLHFNSFYLMMLNQ
ncbi:toll/interleukin-1 receptor domain-containing protein [candidate division KSB1 bacterium]|nr:toll/interleukin-1 receptor domain-containing protein [candidate division KSB1 bacterium]